MNGQILAEQTFTRQLDISTLAAGLYFIEVKNENVVERKEVCENVGG